MSLSGGIELTVFSEHFRVELDVVDIQTQRVDRFGENTYIPNTPIIFTKCKHQSSRCVYTHTHMV